MLVNTVHELGAALRGRRIELGLSQAEIAKRVGVSRPWLSRVENGRPKAEIGLVLAVLASLGLVLCIDEDRGGATDNRVDIDVLLEEYRRE